MRLFLLFGLLLALLPMMAGAEEVTHSPTGVYAPPAALVATDPSPLDETTASPAVQDADVPKVLSPIAPDRKGLASVDELFSQIVESTGLYQWMRAEDRTHSIGQMIMMVVGLLLIYLAIFKKFEPLLLLPIGFGALLTNIPLAGMSDPGGFLDIIYTFGIETTVFPLLIFLGVGALTDFGPLLANPKTALLGAAAQFGIFGTLIGAVALNLVPGISFTLADAASIAIIGGADGPTSIFLASQLSPRLLGAVAVAAYSYMALVPLIQPPLMRLVTTKAERQIRMKQLRPVSKIQKIMFPVMLLALTIFLLPRAAPLIGMLMFGNLLRECGVVDRLTRAAQNELLNVVTIFLGLGIGSRLSAETFLSLETVGIILLGLVAFSLGTLTGLLIGKLMCKLTNGQINPLIGAAGVSAVPMAARVVQKVGQEEDPDNFLLMHAMGPNVAGVIGSAVAAGVLLAIFGG
jgi:oxaloacetate decarboxylase beta subunit